MLLHDGATLTAEFFVPFDGIKLQVELWYSSNNSPALNFIKEFDTYAHQLSGYIQFHPRFVTWACPECTPEFKESECIVDGKYCAPNHAYSVFSNEKGRDILAEDLRQGCLHDNLVKKGAKYEPIWWDYIKYVHSRCYGLITEECSKLGHEELNLDWEATNQCVQDTFDDAHYSNSVFAENSKKWREYGTAYWPSVTINNVSYRGDITAENIMEALCGTLQQNLPKACKSFFAQEGVTYFKEHEQKMSTEAIVGIVAVLVSVNLGLLYAYR